MDRTATKPTRADKFLFLGVGLFALSVPLSIAPASMFFFCSLIFWVVAVVLRKRTVPIYKNPLFIPVFLFIGCAVTTSLLFGVDKAHSAHKFHRLLYLLPIFMLPDALDNGKSGHDSSGMFLLILAFLCGCSLLALYDVFRIVPLLTGPKEALYDAGNMRDPQFYLVALCFLPLCGFFVSERPLLRRLRAVATLLCAAGLVLHFKRGVWLSYGIACIVMILATRRWKAFILMLAVAGAMLFLPLVQQRILNLKEDQSMSRGGRLLLWEKVAPPMMEAYPHGVGWCAVQRDMMMGYNKDIEPGLDHFHNVFIQMRIELGPVGMVLWAGWMLTALAMMSLGYRRLKAEGRPEAAIFLACGTAMIGLLANGLIENNFGDSEIMMLYSLVMAWSVALWMGMEHSNSETKED